jgi:hypothetical protein
MSADDDVADAQYGDGVFDAGRHRVGTRAVGRHEIAGGPNDEQLARFAAGDQFRYNPSVGTADEQGARRVVGGQLREQTRLHRVDVLFEVPDALGDARHGSHLRG